MRSDQSNVCVDRLNAGAWAFGLFLVCGCQSNDELGLWRGTQQRPIVFGEDNRLDYFQYYEMDSEWASAIRDSSVALLRRGSISSGNPDDIFLMPRRTLEQWGVCSDERFAQQFNPVLCSGTLIDKDLVLTAGHCVYHDYFSIIEMCRRLALVFDFAMQSETVLARITEDDVYHCDDVVAYELGRVGVGFLDYAIIRLDRPVVGRIPAAISGSRTGLPEGIELITAGYSSGLPLKIDDGGDEGGRVQDARADILDYFVANLDTFGGNSGSGVFLEDTRELVGVLVRGLIDYERDEENECDRVRVCPNDGCNGLAEHIGYAFPALDEYCSTVESARVCPCGNGVCDADERSATCCTDCGSVCGDGTCNCSENARQCPADCGTCGNGICEADADEPTTCCTDCGCPADYLCERNTCRMDPVLGDLCSRPQSIEAKGTQTIKSESKRATDAFVGSCGTGAARDRVFAFTLDKEMDVSASVSGFDTVLYLRSDCRDPSSELACNDDDASGPGGSSRIALQALEPGSYFLFVDGFNDWAYGDFTLSVSFMPHDEGTALRHHSL